MLVEDIIRMADKKKQGLTKANNSQDQFHRQARSGLIVPLSSTHVSTILIQHEGKTAKKNTQKSNAPKLLDA